MKTKLLRNPIGYIQTQDSAREAVQGLRNIWDVTIDRAKYPKDPANQAHDKVHADFQFQLAMLIGITALLDEGNGTVDVGGLEDED